MRTWLARSSRWVLAAPACLLPIAATAQTDGLFGSLFGLFGARSFPQAPYSRSYADPAIRPDSRDTTNRNPANGEPQIPAYVFCVRLCDGRYFPLSASEPGRNAQKLCRALCPASPTKIFSGGTIEQAIASDGATYPKLAVAFAYRDRLIAGCTCNGKTIGLASVDILADPTLRRGDMIATRRGLVVFNGSTGPRHKRTEFSRVRNADRLLGKTRGKANSRAVGVVSRQSPDRPAR